jgi:hypothetical protein
MKAIQLTPIPNKDIESHIASSQNWLVLPQRPKGNDTVPEIFV